MAHHLEAAKSGRARCATCGRAIAKGATRVAEEYYAPGVPVMTHRYHHLECALTSVPDVVIEALAVWIMPDTAVDHATHQRRVAWARELEQRARDVSRREAAPDVRAGDLERELLGELERRPEDPDVLAVLADLLQGRGDPRGELIAVQLALAAEAGDPAPLLRRRDTLILQLSPPIGRSELLAWGTGYVRRAALSLSHPGEVLALASLLRHPSMRLASELELSMMTPYDSQAMIDALAGARERLRRVVIDNGFYVRPAALVASLPRLTQLGLSAYGFDLEPLAHPRLERLVLEADDGELAKVLPWLSQAALPCLHELGLRQTRRVTDEVCEALAQTGWLARLTKLDLVTGSLGPAGVEALERGLAGRRLALLDVTGNRVSRRLRARLAALCDRLVPA